jgi:hypothetical protein
MHPKGRGGKLVRPVSNVALRLFYWFLAVDLLWFALHFAVNTFGLEHTAWRSFLGLGYEANPPTWWASMILFLVALPLFLLASKPFVDHPAVKPLRWGLVGAGVIFTYMSIDEMGTIHERISIAMKARYGAAGAHWYVPNLSIFPAWVFLWAFLILVLVGAVIYVPRLFRLWPTETLIVLAGLVIYVTGAMAFERIAEAIHLTDPTLLFVEQGIEETLEMVGATIVFYGVARVLFAVAAQLFPKPEVIEPAAKPERPAP